MLLEQIARVSRSVHPSRSRRYGGVSPGLWEDHITGEEASGGGVAGYGRPLLESVLGMIVPVPLSCWGPVPAKE